MLTHVHVKNMALIDEAEVEFGPGLNVLTGETGAGKSILIGSVGMALGKKTSRDVIREGADHALAELVFEVEDSKTIAELAAMDIVPEDGQIIKAEMTNERIPPPAIPQTGDGSNLTLWLGLGGIALGGLAACGILYFKRKKDEK